MVHGVTDVLWECGKGSLVAWSLGRKKKTTKKLWSEEGTAGTPNCPLHQRRAFNTHQKATSHDFAFREWKGKASGSHEPSRLMSRGLES